jgi:hypothetical protein
VSLPKSSAEKQTRSLSASLFVPFVPPSRLSLTWIDSQFFPADKAENIVFRNKLANAAQSTYVPSHAVTRQVRMSGLTLSKITSSLMITHGESKMNIGLNLKFEAKSQKVLGYSRKGESGWEFSTKAIALIQELNSKFPEIAETLDRKRSAGEFPFLFFSIECATDEEGRYDSCERLLWTGEYRCEAQGAQGFPRREGSSRFR